MENQFYFPAIWLVIAAMIVSVVGATSALAHYRRVVALDASLYPKCQRQLNILSAARWALWAGALALTLGGATAWLKQHGARRTAIAEARARLMPVFDKEKVWEGPNVLLAETDPEAELIAYGRDLIANTQDYFGPEGLVKPGAINGLNCQNCHLDAGSKPFGNNYFAVESTYPQMRARSGTLETIPKRVNDCFQRSLNGQPLDSTSREMRAIIAYMRWLGTGVPKKEKPKGAGLLEVPFLDRAADPLLGKTVYVQKCASCHGTDGQGLPIPNTARSYPPLWGDDSYNEAAGLFRLSRFAGYVKANMPFGASYQSPQLSDEEAWDVAAYVNSQPRPKHPFLQTDWPKIEKKPFDHPFGPYADTFPEHQHKYGPFPPILAYYSSRR
jgi:thiosulfate dehydrogenase